MSLVKATASLNDIAGHYNLIEILNNSNQCRPDPVTCSLTPQKIDQLQQVLIKISRNYADDPMLSKLFALTLYSSNNKTLKGGRHKNFRGGFKGILSIITLAQRVHFLWHSFAQIFVGSIIGALIGYGFFYYAQIRIRGSLAKKEEQWAPI